MERQLALWSLLLPQPIIGVLLWASMRYLIGLTPVPDGVQLYATGVATVVLYAFWSYMFARGFLRSSEAQKLGFR